MVDTIQLRNGTRQPGLEMPALGFGVYQVSNEEIDAAVDTALRTGYRSIDTATLYGNEKGVGAAVARSGIAREDLFITTKLWNTDQGHDSALRAFDTSLAELGLDYVDLYLIHWPVPSQDLYVETWQAFEQILADGRAKAIGVSNFQETHLRRLLAETDVVPAVNQIELHPRLSQPELRAFHDEHGIVTEAWAPLARAGELFETQVITSIANKHGKTPAQVVLRWHRQLGNVTIPKSITPSRIAENLDIFDFELDAEDMAEIGRLDTDGRQGPIPDSM